MNSFGTSSNVSIAKSGGVVVALFIVLAAVIVVAYLFWPTGTVCPTRLIRADDGSLRLEPTGQVFRDMNAFQQWWHTSGENASCPIPILAGARPVPVLQQEGAYEETYAKTPIYKVDDYEFSRVFGYEKGGHMIIPRQNFNKILTERFFDWVEKPYSSEERRAKALAEGFLSNATPVQEVAARYGEYSDEDEGPTKEDRKVAKMVAKMYANDPDFEPVVTRVGINNWEVAELKPKRRATIDETVDENVVNTANEAVDIQFRFREQEDVKAAIDPYFENLPQESGRGDPYVGPVPGMERMFGPTFDHTRWY